MLQEDPCSRMSAQTRRMLRVRSARFPSLECSQTQKHSLPLQYVLQSILPAHMGNGGGFYGW